MRIRLVSAVAGLTALAAVPVQPARAIGCVSGGAAGAIAGHAVHHGVLGAVGGCVAGHYAHKHQKAAEQRRENASEADQKQIGSPGSETTAPARTE